MATRPDWEAIESAYRAGSLSIRAIGEKYGVSEGTIRSRAKSKGWLRDLTEQVSTATRDKISRSTSRRDFTHVDVREDYEIIDQASDEAAAVVIAHREGLAAWRGITNKLRGFLDDAEITEGNRSEEHTSELQSLV